MVIFVHKNIYPQVVDKLSKAIQETSSGPGNSLVGAISMETGLEKIKKQIQKLSKVKKLEMF